MKKVKIWGSANSKALSVWVGKRLEIALVEMLPGGFVPVDRILKWKTGFCVASLRVRREPRSKLNQLWQLGDTATSIAHLVYTLPGYSEAPTGLGGCFSSAWPSSWPALGRWVLLRSKGVQRTKCSVLLLLSLPSVSNSKQCWDVRAVCHRKKVFANPTECSLCPSHFPELQFVSASALHAVSSQKPHLTGCICPQTMIEAIRWSLHLSRAVKTAQGAVGTGLHTPKCPLSRASPVGCLLSLLGDSVEPQSRLSEGVNREEETAGRAVWLDVEYFCPQPVSNWKSSQTSLRTDQNISQPSEE